jgi:hypothetical protein
LDCSDITVLVFFFADFSPALISLFAARVGLQNTILSAHAQLIAGLMRRFDESNRQGFGSLSV